MLCPVVNSVLSRQAQITGRFSQREAYDLANVSKTIRWQLNCMKCTKWGRRWRLGARDSSINAVKWGALVVGFMILYYFIGGVVAVLSAMVNVLICLGVLSSLGNLDLAGCRCLGLDARDGCGYQHFDI